MVIRVRVSSLLSRRRTSERCLGNMPGYGFLGPGGNLSLTSFCGVWSWCFWLHHHWDLSNCLYRKKAYWSYSPRSTHFRNDTFEYADIDSGWGDLLFLLDLSLIFAYKLLRNHWCDRWVLLLDQCWGLRVLIIHRRYRKSPIIRSLVLHKMWLTVGEWWKLLVEFG